MKLFCVDILVYVLYWALNMKFGTSIVILRSENVVYYCDKFGHGSSFIRNLILFVIWANWNFCEIGCLGWIPSLKSIGKLYNSMNDDANMNTFNAWTVDTGVWGDSMFSSMKHESIITNSRLISWLVAVSWYSTFRTYHTAMIDIFAVLCHGFQYAQIIVIHDDPVNKYTTISNIHCTFVKFFFIMNIKFHFVLYYLDITASEFVNFMAILCYITQYVHTNFCIVFVKAESHVMSPFGPNNISFMGKNNDNFICTTNLHTILLSLSQALFVCLYPFLMVLVGYLYRHISVLFAFSSGSLEYHWLPALPFVWCGKYAKRNHYVQILNGAMTKLLVVQPKGIRKRHEWKSAGATISASTLTKNLCYSLASEDHCSSKAIELTAFGPRKIVFIKYCMNLADKHIQRSKCKPLL